MDYDNFDISLGIRKNGKLVNIKKEKKVLVKLKNPVEKEEIHKNEKIMGLSIDFDILDDNMLENKISKADDIMQDYDINEINFIDKTAEIKIQNLKKALIIDLKKYFKKHHLGVLEKIEDVSLKIKPTLYDKYQLNYDLNIKFENKYFKMQIFNNINDNLFIDYFSHDSFNQKLINKLQISTFENSYKNYKIIADILGYDVILLNKDQILVDESYNKKSKKLYFMVLNEKIYALDKIVDVYYKLKIYTNHILDICLKRDIEKNSKFVLFEDLNKFSDFYIYFPRFRYSTFKYQYLLNNLYFKKVNDITLEQINILNYVIKNFGLHFYLFNDMKIIDKSEFTLDFINNHQTFSIDNISLFDYKNYNKSEDIDKTCKKRFLEKYEDFDYYYTYNNHIITGITKDEVYDKCLHNFKINIEKHEIHKNLSILRLNKIKNKEDLDFVLSVFPNVDKLIIFNFDNHKILSDKHMNFTKPMTFEYILKLSEKITECKICKCKLSNIVNNDNFISIDAKNPLLGHTIDNDNIDLLCGNCNIMKGTNYLGKYYDKPYFYDINTLKHDKLVELLKYHKQKISGITHVLRKRLDNYIKNIDKT